MRLERNEIFDSSQLRSQLQRKSIRGGVNTLGGQLTLFSIQMISTMVLARLLTPADYGLVSMVAVVVGFAALFKSFGLSEATVQRGAISHEQISALFWVNLGVSLALTVCMLAASPLVAAFYHQPELTAVTAALSASLLLNGVTVQHAALLQRHMRFGALAVLQVLSQAVVTGVSIALALAGFRYWALVGGTLAGAGASMVGTFYLCPWMPGRFRKGVGALGMVRFGANVTGFEFANYFSRSLDNILIGRFIGAAELGYYAKAYQLFMLPITQIRVPVIQVALPVLSSLRTDPQRFNRYYERLTAILSMLIVPLTCLLFLEADFVVRLMLGAQWSGTVPLFRILAVAGLVQGVASTRGVVMLSHGYSSRYLRWGVANSVIMSTAFVVGLPYGAAGVAGAYTIANYAVLVPSLFYCFHGTPARVATFFRTMLAPLGLSAVALVSSLAMKQLLSDWWWLSNLAACVAFLLAYAGLSLLRPVVRDSLSRLVAGLPIVQIGRARRGGGG